MVKFNNLTTNKKPAAKRAGRGISAGRGKTAGRGTKGQNSRSGGRVKPGFEGGQNPLYARLPKLPGFKSRKPATLEITTDILEKHFKSNDTVDVNSLAEKNLISNSFRKVKIILGGDITKSFKVSVQAISAQAEKAIVKAGGSVTIVDREKRLSKQDK